MDQRLAFLRVVYNSVRDNVNSCVSGKAVGKALGLSLEDTRQIIDYLAAKGYIERKEMGAEWRIRITYEGIEFIEGALKEPDVNEQGHRPLSSVTYNVKINTVSDSQMMFGSPGASQEKKVESFTVGLKSTIDIIEGILSDPGLPEEVKTGLAVESENLKEEASKETPDRGKLKTIFGRLLPLIKAAAAAGVQLAIQNYDKIIALVQGL
jgi:predicted transcriptional regulator